MDSNNVAVGPHAAWLSFLVTNTGGTPLNNVTATFSGFTGGTHPEYFASPSDPTRNFSTLAAGQQMGVFYYVDYSEALNHAKGATANYSISVTSADLAAPVVYNGTVTSDTCLSTDAGGLVQSSNIGPGVWVGQILTENATFSFGNVSDPSFQPSGDAGFPDEYLRLVGNKIVAVTGTVPVGLIGQKDKLEFITNITGAGGTITVTFYWQVIGENPQQTVHPWALARSGTPYKYGGISASTIIAAGLTAVSIGKSVSPGYLATDNKTWPVEYTVTFTNSTPVSAVVDNISDTLPAGMKMINSTASGSDVTAANSSSVPAANSTGTVAWVGKSLGYSNTNTSYSVPAGGTLTLKYTVDVSECPESDTPYTNSAYGGVSNVVVGPASADFYIGNPPIPAFSLTKTAAESSYSALGSILHYTLVASNDGNVSLSHVSINDAQLTGLTPAYPQDVSLAPGENLTVTGTHTITQPDLDTGQVYNLASASCVPPTGGSLSATDNATVNALQNPSIAIVKKGDVSGNTVNYTFTVTNTGNVTLTNVRVSDPKVTVTGGPIASLAPGASDNTTFSGSYTLKQSDIDAGYVENTATARGTPPAGPDVTGQGSVRMNFVPAPSLSLVKTGTLDMAASTPTNEANAGDVINYTFTVTNTGNITLTNVSVSDPKVTVSGGPIASLAPGASDNTTFSGSYTLTQDDIDKGYVNNTAKATSDQSPPEYDSEDVIVTMVPGLSIQKSGSIDPGANGRADAGDVLTFTFKVTNIGNVTLTNISISDPKVTVTGGPLASLAPGASDNTTFSGSYTLAQDDIDAGYVENAVTAAGTPPDGPVISENGTTVVNIDQLPSLSLVKNGTLDMTASTPTDEANSGDIINYTFTVTNTGNVTLTNVSVSDPKVTVTGGPIASLAPGASDNTTFGGSYTLTQDDIDRGSISNTARASSDQSPPTYDSNVIVLAGAPGLSIQKSGSLDPGANGRADEGDVVTFTFKVTNIGNLTLSNISISDPKVTVSGGPIASLAPGASDNTTFSGSYTLTQDDIDAGYVENTATAAGTPPEKPVISENGTTVVNIGQLPSLSLVKKGTLDMTVKPLTNEANVGDIINYTFTVTNTGNITLTNVSVSDPKVTVSGGPIASLAPGSSDNTTFSGSYTLTQDDIDKGYVNNTAEATSDQSPPEYDSEDVIVTMVPGLSILKSGSLDPGASGRAAAGDNITFNFKITNIGNVTLTNIIISDPKVTVTGGPLASLAPGASDNTTFSGRYTLTQADIDRGYVENTATASGTPPDGPAISENGTVAASILQVPSLSIVKTGTLNMTASAPANEANAGDTISYSFLVTNTGTVTLTNVTVSDPKISNISPASIATLAPGAVATFTGTYKLTAADIKARLVTNTATVSAVPPSDIPISSTGLNTLTIPIPKSKLPVTPGTQTGPGGSSLPAATSRPYIPVTPTTDNLTITPQYALVNQPVTVRAQIYNAGLDKSKYTAILKVNGQVEGYSSGTVDSRSAVAVEFPLTLTAGGDYLIDINGQQSYMNVKDQHASLDNIISYIPVIGFIFCALGIVLVSILLARRNRFDQ